MYSLEKNKNKEVFIHRLKFTTKLLVFYLSVWKTSLNFIAVLTKTPDLLVCFFSMARNIFCMLLLSLNLNSFLLDV